MHILSFDTSSNAVNVALMEDHVLIEERCINPSTSDRKDIGAALMPAIDAAIRQVKWKKSDIDFIVVGIGPGSFTGIRLAVVTARTLAQVFSIGLLGISSLECLYYASGLVVPGGIILSGTSQQYFYAGYEHVLRDGKPISTVITPTSGSAESLQEVMPSVKVWLADEKRPPWPEGTTAVHCH